MKSILLFKPQSFIDVITNSSSEIFVCDKKHSVQFVEEFLRDLVERYNSWEGDSRTYERCFGEVYMIDEDNLKEFVEDIVIGWDLTSPAWGLDPIPEYADDSRSWKERSAEFDRLRAEWMKNNLEKLRQHLIGSIVIRDADDNSIPYEMWDKIEMTLNAMRRHLG